MQIILNILLVILLSKIGGFVALKLKQPEVLGELVIGIIVGNLLFFGINVGTFDFLRDDHIIEVLSEIGIIFLLFAVGLETRLDEMKAVGLSALLAAVLGVVAPFFMGLWVSAYFVPSAGIFTHVFVGATLTATSVGISVRVLQELGVIKMKESKIILGAAVIDDILGLMVLAVVTGLITAENSGESIDVIEIALILVKALGFVVAAVFIGKFLMRPFFTLLSKLPNEGSLFAGCLIVCLGFSYLADLAGLAPIVGAFLAGMIIQKEDYKIVSTNSGVGAVDDFVIPGKEPGHKDMRVEEFFKPLIGLLVPIFFLSMGARVDLNNFTNTSVLAYALVLTVVAMLGKQACSLGVLEKGVDKIAVGLGMIPRGEVGLIFISIGAKLFIAGHPVISPETFSAVIIVVVLTTVVTPIAVKMRFLRILKRQ